jgi:hypothetical protein
MKGRRRCRRRRVLRAALELLMFGLVYEPLGFGDVSLAEINPPAIIKCANKCNMAYHEQSAVPLPVPLPSEICGNFTGKAPGREPSARDFFGVLPSIFEADRIPFLGIGLPLICLRHWDIPILGEEKIAIRVKAIGRFFVILNGGVVPAGISDKGHSVDNLTCFKNWWRDNFAAYDAISSNDGTDYCELRRMRELEVVLGSLGSSYSGINRLAVQSQRLPNEKNAGEAEGYSYKSRYGYDESPYGHLPLGVKIGLVTLLSACGLLSIAFAFARSERITETTALTYILFGFGSYFLGIFLAFVPI